jgi:glycosyltransferase involved in cell wall biosynthesis
MRSWQALQMRSPIPRLAAVVCTHNRATLLGRTLESLAAQTLDRTAYEVIVIDDGSTDDSREVAEAFAPRLPLTYAYQRPAGLASAKNHGLFRTLSPLVLFLDDDDVADRELLEWHVRAHERFPELHYAVLGYTGLAPELIDDPLMQFVTRTGRFLFSYPDITHGDVLDYTYFWGGRSSCKRAFLLQHGVFNPVFRFGCEDIELGFRLSRHGLRVVYEERAVSTMVRGFTLDEFCDRLVRQGRSNAVFSRLHDSPEVQRWTEVAGAVEMWARIATGYPAISESARRLDAMARRKRQMGFNLDTVDVEWLHVAYWDACRASKIKGIAEAAYEA